MASVYTIRFMAQLHHMFFLTTCVRLMGPSSGMLAFIQSPFPPATLARLASVYTLGVRGMYVLCLSFFLRNILFIGINKILNYYIKTRIKLSKMLNHKKRANEDHTYHALPMCKLWPVWRE
jgi:hypothetical protein